MRTFLITAWLAAGTYTAVAAQGTSRLPACAAVCQHEYNGPGFGSCAPNDLLCICTVGGPLKNIGCCIRDYCDEADQRQAVAWADNSCRAIGITFGSLYCEEPTSMTTDTVPEPTPEPTRWTWPEKGLPSGTPASLPPANPPPGPNQCDPADFLCVCSSGGALRGIDCCLRDTCGAIDQETAMQWADQMCKGVGIELGAGIVCAAPPSVISEMEGSKTVNMPMSTSGGSGRTSVKAVAPTSSVQQAVESGTSTVEEVGGTSGVVISATSTQTATPAAFTGGASGYKIVGGGGIVGGLVAALAFL